MRGWRPRRESGWSPIRFAQRSALGHRRGQTLALVAVAALVTACTAFAPIYDRAMQQALVDTLLVHARLTDKTVIVQSESLVTADGSTDAQDPRELQAMVPGDVAALLDPPVLGRSASATPLAGDVPPTGPLVWRDGACAHVRVLSGTCPSAPGEILVSEVDVETFDLPLGSTPRVGSAIQAEPVVRLEVVGTYAPTDEAWWQGEKLLGISNISKGTDPSAAHDAWLTTEETFTGGSILLGETSQSGAAVPTETTGVDELLTLADRVDEMSDDVRGNGRDLAVLTGIDDVTDDVRAQTRQAHRTVPLLMAPLAVLAIFVLWLVLAAATEQRREEVAVARLRGRGPAGAVALLLIELLPVLLLGVVPGAIAALFGGARARGMLPGAAPLEAGPGFAIAVLLAVAAVVLTTVAAAVLVAREPLEGLLRSGRVTSRRWSLGALDAFLIAAVGTGVLAFVTGSLSGPLALLGPALLALFAGLLLAHLTGPAASTLGRRLLRRGRLVTGVTLLEMARRRETRAAMVVITVVSALAVFALDAFVVGDRTRTHASEHDAGAPVVLRLDGRDLVGVREALGAVDPSGDRATPVVVSGTTLAVVPDGFRRIALFPRGAPTAGQWRALAPPDKEPMRLTGSRIAFTVRTDPELTSKDAFGSDSNVVLSLVVTTGTGTRRTVPLGAIPSHGDSAKLVGDVSECASGCTLTAVEFTGSAAVVVEGEIELSDVRVDGRPTTWWSSADDWNATEDTSKVVRPLGTATNGDLRLLLSIRGIYPVELTPAWVPQIVPAILPTARRDALGLDVTGVDGSDRPARSAGRITLIPTMPARSALVDLDAISRGAEITHDAHAEAWLVDDPDLVAAVTTSLRERGIVVAETRRVSTVRQTHQDTVATWSLALGVVIGPVVLLLALLVLLVLAVTGWRERARDLAILRLNGAGRRTTRRLAVCAQLPAILLSVAAGVGAGVVGAALAMPDVSFFPTRPEVPVIDTAISWPAVAYVAACLLLLPVAAALAGRAVARRADLERVKEPV